MKFSCLHRSLHAAAIVSAVFLMAPASAQTAPADAPAATGTTAEQAIRATTRAQNRAQGITPRHHTAPRHSRHNRDRRDNRDNRRGSGSTGAGEPPNASRLATDRGATAADYERNALARCEVFKTHENRMACVERMRQTPQGSVEGGGLLWEFSYQVPAAGS